MKIAFEALVKQMTVKSLVCGEKEARLVLQFVPTDDTLDKINRLHKADDSIVVVLMDEVGREENE